MNPEIETVFVGTWNGFRQGPILLRKSRPISGHTLPTKSVHLPNVIEQPTKITKRLQDFVLFII